MRRRRPTVSQVRLEPNSLTATVHLGPVQRHVGSMNDRVNFCVQWFGNRDSNAAADNYLGVTDGCDLPGDLPQDSVRKLGEAVGIELTEPPHDELIASESCDGV